MEKNTTKTEVREKIQELLKTLKRSRKKSRCVWWSSWDTDVCPPVYRITEEGQPAGELSVCRIPNGMVPGRGRSGGGQRSWQLRIRYSTVLPWWSRDILWKLQDWKKTVCG